MAVVLRESRRFSAESPVSRYWLANCVGFSLAGGRRGIVEAVLAEDDPHEPTLLVVRSGRHRVVRLPAEQVTAVIPSEHVLVVERTPRPSAVKTQLAARVTGRLLALLAAQAWLVARSGPPLAIRGARRGWTAASPTLAAAGRSGRTYAARLVRSRPWQRSGPSARFGSTRRLRGRSRSSLLRRTMSFLTESGSGSED